MDGSPRAYAVAHDVRRRIENGEWGVGERLPSLEALVAHYGASWAATRAAMRSLAHEGLIERRMGRARGYWVAEPSKPAPKASAPSFALVARSLRELIASGAMRPGETVDVPDLARTYAVSTDTIKQARHVLVGEGLVVKLGGPKPRYAVRTPVAGVTWSPWAAWRWCFPDAGRRDLLVRALQDEVLVTVGGHDRDPAGDWVCVSRDFAMADAVHRGRWRALAWAVDEWAHLAVAGSALVRQIPFDALRAPMPDIQGEIWVCGPVPEGWHVCWRLHEWEHHRVVSGSPVRRELRILLAEPDGTPRGEPIDVVSRLGIFEPDRLQRVAAEFELGGLRAITGVLRALGPW